MPYVLSAFNLIPDPTLNKIIYVGQGPQGSFDRNITLWDLKNKKTLTQLTYFDPEIWNYPLWSLDGNDFVMAYKWFDWYQVTREGKVKQLTQLKGIVDYKLSFKNSTRSPDGRFLAFGMVYSLPNGEETHFRYLILDLSADPVTGFCLGPEKQLELSVEPRLYWSPDSRYLAISDYSLKDFERIMVLTDVINQKAYRLTDHFYVLQGWIKT